VSPEGSVAPFTARVSAELVDRDDVLGLAVRRWQESQNGMGQFVLISGEAGIGKTRVLDEVAKQLDVPIFSTRAWPRDMEAPGAIIIDMARELRRRGSDEDADRLLERLMRDDNAGDPARRHRLLVGDLADMMITRLTECPTLLRIEDLHWADELSLEVLERLAPMVRLTSSLVLATYRSDEIVSGSALAALRTRLLQQRFAEEVPLQRLTSAGTAMLAEALLGEVPPSDFLETLHERSNGIPLHIEELIAAGGSHTVPETVAEAVRERTARLDLSVCGIVGAAAVIGCSFEFDLLAEVTGESGAEVDRALRVLRDQHIVVALTDTKFDFRHALIRDALYEDMTPFRKRTVHEAVARASERAGIRQSYLSEQFELAQLPGEAHEHAVASARAAARMSAHREAADLYERAARTQAEDAPAAEVAHLNMRFGIELAAIDQDDRAAVCFELAIEKYREAGDVEHAAALTANLMNSRHLMGADLAQRIELAETALGWLDAEPGDHDWARANVLGAMSAAYLVSDRLDAARTYAEQAAALIPDDPDELCDQVDVRTTLGATMVFAGDTEAGWALLEEVTDTATGARFEAEAARARRMLGTSASVLVEYGRATRWIAEALQFTAEIDRWNDYNYLLSHRAHVRWATGADGAERDARQALVDGRGITTEIQSYIVLGYVALSRGDFPQATAQLEHALELGEQMNELQRIAPALWGLAEVAVHEERYDEATALCERVYGLAEEQGDAANLFPFVLTGTRAYLAARDSDAARSWVDRCTAVLRRRGIPGTLPAIDHAEGLIHQAEGRVTQARELLERASAAWDERERFWEGVQALVDLARCAVRGRRAGEAARLAAEARRRANGAGATVLVRLAETVKLDPTADAASGPLTAREFEVARLIAAGATNREIAEQLVISPKTASTHVEHILAKLGVARRAEVAAWVSRG
jgi:DNA-binding CsgD family transcriptional regulator/DNA-binding transcriptional ArsR family regulator